MNEWAEAKISLDVNSAGMPRYRVELEGPDGPVYGTGYALADACAEALRELDRAGMDKEPPA